MPVERKRGGQGAKTGLYIVSKKFIVKDKVISSTLTGGGHSGGNHRDMDCLVIPEATKQGFAIAEEGDGINLSQPNSKTRRGRVGKGVVNALETQPQQFTLQGKRIRRLTEVECERLQGFTDGWTEGISGTQRYKCLGNAVSVPIVKMIVERMFATEFVKSFMEAER